MLVEYATENALDLSQLDRSGTRKHQAHPFVLADQFKRLSNLLDEGYLAAEIAALQQDYQLHVKNFNSRQTFTGLAKELVTLSRDIADVAALIPVIAETESVTSDIIRFEVMQRSVRRIPDLAKASWKASTLIRAVNQQLCLAWITVYDWFSATGIRLANSLMQKHRGDGASGFQQQHPTLTGLVDHIVQYVVELTLIDVTRRLEKGPNPSRHSTRIHNCIDVLRKIARSCLTPKTRSLQIAVSDQPLKSSDVLEVDEAMKVDMSKIPADMFGLLPGPSKDTPLASLHPSKLRKLKGQFKGSEDDIKEFVYSNSATLLFDLWSYHIILPQLRCIDSTIKRRNKVAEEDILDRAITRGAILAAISEACGGPAIFTCTNIQTFIQSPAMMFNPSIQKDHKFAAAVRKDPFKVLAPLFDELKGLLETQPGIIDKAAALERMVHRSIAGFANGSPLTEEEEFDEPAVKPHSPTSFKASKSKSGPNLQQLGKSQPKTTSDLLLASSGCQLRLGMLGVILREALNRKRSLPAADEKLGRLLGNKPIAQSSAVDNENPNQTDPLRRYSQYAQHVSRYLPSSLLTRKTGLSSLLSFMGTGQGWGTRKFLGMITQDNGFCCDSLNEMVELFQRPISMNAALFTSGADGRHSSFIRCFDMSIWGQPSWLLSIRPAVFVEGHQDANSGSLPTVTPTDLRAKFEPYWADRVQDVWVKLLGDMYDQDPATWEGPRPNWTETIDAIAGLRIPLFNQSLTLLQTVNNLSYQNVCQIPSAQEVGAWISQNSNLGAMGGLRLLKFSLQTKVHTQVSVQCVHEHLDKFLTKKDKEDLGFDGIFLEQVLCKIRRWTTLYDAAMGKGAFSDMVKEIEAKDQEWTPGANETDPEAFPFPLHVEVDLIESVIKKITVCNNSLIFKLYLTKMLDIVNLGT